jgi:hypothetical protein
VAEVGRDSKDKARALEVYAAQGRNLEAERQATKITAAKAVSLMSEHADIPKTNVAKIHTQAARWHIIPAKPGPTFT